ncbi:hypothetical protein APHAL10511_003342 [Amanita phalloides]|nr:hypothetical protein APHAL10511_003342 [Amanita phalloides]
MNVTLARRLLRHGYSASVFHPRNGARHVLTYVHGRRAYSVKSTGPASFDRLFSFLALAGKPGSKILGQDDMALLIAALFSSTNNAAKLTRLETALAGLIAGYDKAGMYKRVDEFMKQGLDLEKVEATLQARLGVKSADKIGLSESGTQASLAELVPRKELEGKSRLDQLFLYLETPHARSVLQNLESEDAKEFTFLMRQVMDSSGLENMGVLNTIRSFLGLRGVNVVYLREEEMEKSRTATMTMDPVEFAKRAAVEESMNPLDTPTPERKDPYPNLMAPDPLLDARDEVVFPPSRSSPYTNRVIVRNHKSIFHNALESQSETNPFTDPDSDWEPATTDETSEDLESFENLPLPAHEVKNLYRFPLIVRRVTQQTGKGKIHRVQYLVVVGNGDGLVGYGQGKDEDAPRALAKATALAVRSMDTVARYEKRTVPTAMDSKFGATRILMRPRPVGFGLRCNPNLHRVLKAAGIKDVSAKVWGSRNPVSVVKAAFRMLWGGHAPVGMGDGVGGKGRKMDKGEGVRSVWDVERERGRKLVGLRM